MYLKDELFQELLDSVRDGAFILNQIEAETIGDKLVAFEGIDGSGKATQVGLFEQYAFSNGVICGTLSFPRYDYGIFGAMVGAYLRGEYGEATTLNPQIAALLYAGDRFQAIRHIEHAVRQCDVVAFDRYTASNVAYQTAKIKEVDSRKDFQAWVYKLEHEVFGIPRAKRTIWLDVPVDVAYDNVMKKRKRSYTDDTHDQHEGNRSFLESCRDVYADLCDSNYQSDWYRIDCIDEQGRMRDKTKIASEIWQILSQ